VLVGWLKKAVKDWDAMLDSSQYNVIIPEDHRPHTSAMTPRSYPKRIDPMEANTPTRNWYSFGARTMMADFQAQQQREESCQRQE
jgi:hypothetical protein